MVIKRNKMEKEIDYKQRYEWALEDLVLFSKKITEQREMIVQLQKQLIELDNSQNDSVELN